MTPNERVIILQRQLELMTIRMQSMKEQRDALMDTLVDLFNKIEDQLPAQIANDCQYKIKLLREQLGQDEVL